MSDIEIDSGLNTHLGLPVDYPLDKNEAFELYKYFMDLLSMKIPINSWIIQYYIDKNGDFFNNPKNKRDRIVKDIVENMSRADQFFVMTCISEIEND